MKIKPIIINAGPVRKTILIICLAFFTILFYSGTSNEKPGIATLDELYQKAIIDAFTADSAEICDTLWPISSSNSKLEWKTINNEKYVLAGCFTKYPDSYSSPSVTTSWGVMWVFIPRQMKYRMKSLLNQESDTLLRMRQLLGLPSTNSSNYIAELWIKPGDLYRPAADNEIDDQTAGPYYPTKPDATYTVWFNQNIYDSYFGAGLHYPWTRLGYTYDWAPNASEVGVSEYCVKKNSTLVVCRTYLATVYLK